MQFDIKKFESCHVLVIGDLMIDEYVWGTVDRVSPEAPVQVVQVEREDYTLGGAGNVVNNLRALGANVSVMGTRGPGQNGIRLMEMFEKLGVDTKGVIMDPKRPTTQKTRIIASNQHVLRIDREIKTEITGLVLDALQRMIDEKIPIADVILISDYGKGVLTNDLLAYIFKTAAKFNKTTIVDPKGIDFTKYNGATLLTPNKKEAGIAAGIDVTDEVKLVEAGNKILSDVDLKALLITCGKDGMALFNQGKAPYMIETEAKQVFDVSGAGDTVVSVLGLAIASGAALKGSAKLANKAAGIVVGKIGTATVSKEELTAALDPLSGNEIYKYIQKSDLFGLVKDLRLKNQRIILTNGCFDLLHTGHIQLLSASKRLGDILIVAIDNDEAVQAIKGPGRPVLKAEERVRILSALDSVDYVVVFAQNEMAQIIDLVKPDILTKGSNYTTDEVNELEAVEKNHGQVHIIPIHDNISASKIIKDIKNNA